MHIRCERCQAEYDLDDTQVRNGNADVQCSACGFVFTVAQPGSNQTADGNSAGSLKTGDWFLQTADGGAHRLQGLTETQKWIIERKITRLDRLSPNGQAWQYAGQIVDLVPFFDVVDEADRARAGNGPSQDRPVQDEPARRAPTSATKRRSSPQGMAISVPNDDLHDSDPRFPTAGSQAAKRDSRERPHGGVRVLVGLTVAAGVAFAGIQWQEVRLHSAVIGASPSGGLLASLGRLLARPPEARPAGSAAGQVPGERTTPSPTTKGPVVEALPAPPEPEAVSDKSGPERPVAGHPESYEKLVADGDRALENGANSKAKDLYQKALRLRPAGFKALAGLGFVALDRGQVPAAYEFFKRTLSIKGTYGPGLFGMAEIHRTRGEKALALQSYQRYLQLWPKGSEAAAARRHVTALQARK